HPVIARLQVFCSEDLGAFYLDILKDRLYTTAANSHARRSAQTALAHITHSVLRIMAPMLSFTAEEAWPIFAPDAWRDGGETIFTQTWYRFPEVVDAAALITKWNRIRALRAEVMRAIEEQRIAGRVGSSLQAELVLRVSGEDHALLASLDDDLRFVTITSAATLELAPEGAEPVIEVSASTRAKCERCWHYRDEVGSNPAHPTLCGRCTSNLYGDGEIRRFA